MRVLVLGGTAEARELATALVAANVPLLSSLAGRVAVPALPPGPVRIGGFGGVDGLADALERERITAVVDATHPFAEQISAHAAEAARRTGRPVVRLQRPGWRCHPNAGEWLWVPDVAAACAAVRTYARPFLTTGRGSLPAFLDLAELEVLVRLVDPPPVRLPARWRMILSRGPYRLDSERAILSGHRADVLVTKDSGGEHTVAKLDAAAELDVAVVVVERPPPPAGVPVADNVPAALRWCLAR
jgi:precorrin-6A/cobalt-precorrin-6A reductase